MKVGGTATPKIGWRCTLALGNSFLLIALLVSGTVLARSQTTADSQTSSPASSTAQPQTTDTSLVPVHLTSLPRNVFMDQKSFWTTPLHMSKSQWQWTVPLGFVAAGLLASDTAIEKHAPTDPTTASRAVTFSNAGLAALAGVGGGMFVLGHLTHNEDRRETGLLSGEAGIDALLETEAFKYMTGRERPFTGDGRGRFFQGGTSFPSQHAAISFAIASVIAHQYPGPLTQVLVYGLAGGVSAARFGGQQHFATDVIVGSALGWYTGRQVFRAHSHYSDAHIQKWGTFDNADEVRDPADMGSSYVPLESWVYPAIERLAALGYVQSAFLGMRPWTRMECARLLQEADESTQEENNVTSSDARKIFEALAEELRDETARLNGAQNVDVTMDSVYSRFTGISGTPLHDSLHFGQTVINDYGRPYAEGFNNVTGFTSHAEAGPFTFYVQAEYQRAPSIPPLSAPARQLIQTIDGLPTAPPALATAPVNRVDLLQGYVGLQLKNWQLTFGKQALWWGEDASGPMLFSNNAAPIVMLQINRVTPFKLPSILGALGPIRVDYLVGRLNGYHWLFSSDTGFTGSWTQSLSNQPFIIGQKVSLKPTENLEVGISATSLAGGNGVPFNLHKLGQAMFASGNGNPGTSGDPGDRRGGFDFAYRLPKLRDWVTFYGDAFTEDEVNPWVSWDKAALTSGLYLSRVPKIPKLDFRIEGVYTDLPGGTPVVGHGFFYLNSRFKSGYTHDGNLIGSWIGRQGQGAEAWTNYWFTPKSKLQFHFRHQKISQQFIANGGSLSDFGVSSDFWVHSTFGVSASVQYERWLVPIIQPNASRNVTAAVQISFKPSNWSLRPSSHQP
jgi:membrane-associated phospholipid phosphatase